MPVCSSIYMNYQEFTPNVKIKSFVLHEFFYHIWQLSQIIITDVKKHKRTKKSNKKRKRLGSQQILVEKCQQYAYHLFKKY